MLTPSQYDQLADSLAELYAQLEESILQDMVRRMLKMGYLSDATEWQARMLQEAGMLYDDILAEIAQRTGSTQEQLRTVFQTAGVQAVRNDNYYYQQANVFTHRSMSDSALQVLNAGYVKCSGNLKNLTLTTANTSQQAFIQACNLAYMQVSSGMMDYNTAVRKAVQNAAKDGSTVLYPSGHKDKLDVAVRRAVLTGVGQTVRQVSFQNAKDLETDLMELTAHAGARPSHAEWQGQIVSLSGRKGYLTTQEIGYGSVDGFGGVNCRHDWHPYFEGLPRTYSPERLKELNEPHIQIGEKLYTDYEVSQMQRALERKIREKKRQVIAADALGDKNELQKQSVQLKQAEQNLKDFLNQTGFLNDSARLWVNGFGRSQAQKAVWANRKYQQGKNSKSLQYFTMKSLFTQNLEEYNNGQKDVIKFRNIEKELEKSEIGRDFKKYLIENPCKINIFYNVDIDEEILGIYDPINDEVCIYASNTKTVVRTAEVIIHELTHRRYQICDNYHSECVCRAHEYMHRFRKNTLTESERRSIIKEIKEAYAPLHPDWKWR